MKAATPLHPVAVRAANEKLWADHKELGRRELTLSRGDYPYRKEWMEAYREAIQAQCPTPPTSGGRGKVGAPTRPCPGTTTADLAVHVNRTTDGLPIAGAAVSISGPDSRKGTSDERGNVLFRGVTPGPYQVIGSKSHHLPDGTSATVHAGVTNAATLSLAARTELVVTVTDRATDKPVEAAKVVLTGPEPLEGRTDAQGIVPFSALSPGQYDIAASHKDSPEASKA